MATLEVWSDVVCPWCFVGKRRLARALEELAPGTEVEVVWRPFELNPSMPKGGMPRAEYRAAKFGSLERSRELEARVAEVGRAEGIDFAFDRIERTPNTFDAHRLLWHARREGRQDAAAEALFRAYFLEGLDVGAAGVLAAAGREAGLDGGAVDALLKGTEGAAEVRREEQEGLALGVQGVPFFVVDRSIGVSGAQPAAVLRQALEHAPSRET